MYQFNTLHVRRDGIVFRFGDPAVQAHVQYNQVFVFRAGCSTAVPYYVSVRIMRASMCIGHVQSSDLGIPRIVHAIHELYVANRVKYCREEGRTILGLPVSR